MKKATLTKLAFACVLVLMFLCCGVNNHINAAEGIWTSNGPYGGYIDDIALSPDFLNDQTVFIACAHNGLYRSTDGGTSWEQVIADPYIRAVAVSPNYVVDRTILAGNYKSTDGGTTWATIDQIIDNVMFYAFSPSYSSDQTIFAGSMSNQGIAKSTDGGFTWSRIIEGFGDDLNNKGIAVSPDYLNDTTVFAVQDKGLYKSTNGGASWELLESNIIVSAEIVLSPNYAVDSTLFSTRSGVVYKSTNGGLTWTYANQNDTINLIISPAFSIDNTIFAGLKRGGVARSEDGGLSWILLTTNLPFTPVSSLAISPSYDSDKTIFVGLGFNNDGPGIFKSIDKGSSWDDSNNNLNIGRKIRWLAVSPDHGNDQTVFATASSWLDIFKSKDNCSSWNPQSNTYGNSAGGRLGISPNYANDKTIFAVGLYCSAYKSADGGSTWEERGDGLPYLGWWDIAVSPGYPNDQTVFVAGNAGIYKTTDDGNSWFSVNNGLISGTTVIALSPYYASDQTLFAGNNIHAYKSVDGGSNWISIFTGSTSNNWVSDVAVSPNYATDQTIFIGVSGQGIYKSTDGGVSWNIVNNDAYVIREQSLAISPTYDTDQTILVYTMYQSGTWRGILISEDGGDTWSQLYKTGLSTKATLYPYGIVLSPNFSSDRTIYHSTDDGVWTTILVKNTSPTANAGDDQSVSIGEMVTLDGSKSLDPDGDPLTYKWEIISKPSESNASLDITTPVYPSFIADVPGTYIIELIVNNGTDDSSPDTVSINALNTPPIASVDGPFEGIAGDPIIIDASSSSDNDGDQLIYSWNFGDGNTAVTTEPTAQHIYSTPEIYTVTLTVNDGWEDSAQFETTATITAPIAGGQRKDVDSFLVFLKPFEKTTTLPAGTTSYDLDIIYGETIRVETFKATINKMPCPGFVPIQGERQTVTIELSPGRNPLVLEVDGERSDGRLSTDRDRLVFIVK